MALPRRHGRAPHERRIFTAKVVRTERISSAFLRVTVSGPDLAQLDYQGLDQNFRLFFKAPGQETLRLPSVGHVGWMAQFAAMPAKARPLMRGYTLRYFRADSMELDIDVVIHPGGPAADWALRAGAGEPVGILDEGTIYRIREDADWQLVVADETGVPAALAILEQTSPALPTVAVLEVPTLEDILPTPDNRNFEVTWVTRNDNQEIPGRAVEQTVREMTFPPGRAGVFLAGESGMVTSLRRHLVNEHGYAKADVTFFGYWKHGRGH